jgi:hypothetical protein
MVTRYYDTCFLHMTELGLLPAPRELFHSNFHARALVALKKSRVRLPVLGEAQPWPLDVCGLRLASPILLPLAENRKCIRNWRRDNEAKTRFYGSSTQP